MKRETSSDLFFEGRIGAEPVTMTVNDFRRSMISGSLELRPAFQRNSVWNDEQRSLLVDSILRGLPVPEIYIQRKTSPEGRDSIIVVDGQQRISTVLKYVIGDLKPNSKSENLDERWKGLEFEGLDDSLKSKFYEFAFVARDLPSDMESDSLREIFRRLNQSVAVMTAQELRHAAYSSELLQFVEIAAIHSVLGEIGVFSPRDYQRRGNDELVSEIVLSVTSGAFPNKKDGLEDLFIVYETQGMSAEEFDDLARKFGRVFEQLEQIADRLRKTRFKNKSDFYSLFIFLASRQKVLPLDKHASEELISKLEGFSAEVAEMRGDGLDELEHMTGPIANRSVAVRQYLNSVQRAASDRLNRVRRDQALEFLLADVFDDAKNRRKRPADIQWFEKLESAEEDEDAASDLDALRRALIDADQSELPETD